MEGDDGSTTIQFQNAVIAVGSRPIQLPFIPHEDPRIWDSTDALELKRIPPRLLLMGGGIIGLEMGMVYQALGSQVEVVEMLDQVIPAADKDVVKLFTRATKKVYKYMLETKVTAVEAQATGCPVVAFAAGGAMDIVTDSSGVLFEAQTAEALIEAMETLEGADIDPESCRRNAERFSEEAFDDAMLAHVKALL